MLLRRRYEAPSSVADAEAMQHRLRVLVQADGSAPLAPRTVAGLDVAYDTNSDRLAAAAVVLNAESFEVVDTATAFGRVSFEYVPGLLAFRELPSLVAVLEKLTVSPDLVVCDGFGVAHPRRFGLACHVGVLTDLPCIGVAKTPFLGSYDPPGLQRGDGSDIREGEEILGRVLRTRVGVKPVFVSVGHRISLDDACAQVLRLCRGYRQPETTRLADQLCRRYLRNA